VKSKVQYFVKWKGYNSTVIFWFKMEDCFDFNAL
jgi:hypothetical protein